MNITPFLYLRFLLLFTRDCSFFFSLSIMGGYLYILLSALVWLALSARLLYG